MKFDFDHINPVTGLPRIKERPEDKIQTITRMPSRTGWIKMLQNRVLLNSRGNIELGVKVWFDARRKTVSFDRTGEDAIPFREFRLKNGQRPQGWIEL